MTAAPELSADERARVAAFDAAPQLAESAPMTRAMLALAEELDGELDSFSYPVRNGLVPSPGDRIRSTVAAVLAADPEPRDAVIERMARAMWEHDQPGATPWDDLLSLSPSRDRYRRLAVAALDASRGGTA